MEISLILFWKIAQLFIMLFMGLVVVKTGLLKSSDSKVLSVVLVYLVSPCVIIKAFQIDADPHALTGLFFSIGVAILSHMVFLLLSALLKKPLGLDKVEQATAIYTNASFLIIPLVQDLLGEEYVIYTCGYIIVQTILLWTHSIWLISGENVFQPKKILLNCNIISIFVGLILLLTGIRLPEILEDTISSVSATVGPLGMFLGGMIIAGSSLKEVFQNPRSYLAAALRLLIFPGVLLLFFWLLPLESLVENGTDILMVSFLAACAPACTTVTSQVQLYKKDATKSSRLYVLSTLMSIITMPAMLGLFNLIVG